MSRLEELNTINRERALTEKEVDALYKALQRERLGPRPRKPPKNRRERYQLCKDVVNARKRERYANDPAWRLANLAAAAEWRQRNRDQLRQRRQERRANDSEYRARRVEAQRRWRERRKAKQCSPPA